MRMRPARLEHGFEDDLLHAVRMNVRSPRPILEPSWPLRGVAGNPLVSRLSTHSELPAELRHWLLAFHVFTNQ